MLEKDVHALVCSYIRTKYPQVIFRTDYAAGLKMSIGMAKRHKALQSHSAYPDLFIAEPRGIYCGLFIELKSSNNVLYKKDGTLRKNEHHEEQARMLTMLYARGYQAKFAQGYAEAIKIINDYLESN
jgi:hypothetical protein